MKIAVFIEDFGATGVVRNALAIAGRLAESGQEVILVAARPEGVLRDRAPSGVATVELGSGAARRGRKALMRRSIPSLRKFLRDHKPDVLFSGGNHGHLLCLVASAFLPCRTIVRVSNDLAHGGEGDPNPLGGALRRLKFRFILNRADRVVLVSHRLLEQVAALDVRLARKAVVIPNGVDAETVREQAEGPDSGFGLAPPFALATGRLVPQKNFATLLEALAIARRSADLRLLLIGSGPLRGTLEEQARRLGIDGALRIVDPVPNPFPAMKQAEVVVLPSWWEGSSNVLLEALACGTPVVASRTAGSADEILDRGRYGLLVDPDDPDAMASAILQQMGPRTVPPKDRAKSYDRRASLDAYEGLIAELAAR